MPGALLERPRGMASSHREFQHNWMWKSEDRKMSPADHYGLDLKCLPNSVCRSLGCQFRSSGDVIESWKLWPHQWVVDDATAQGVRKWDWLKKAVHWRHAFGKHICSSCLLAFCFPASRKWATLFSLSLCHGVPPDHRLKTCKTISPDKTSFLLKGFFWVFWASGKKTPDTVIWVNLRKTI